MNLRAFAAAGLLAIAGALLSPPARALVPIPMGSPDGPATDLLTVTGTYALPLPTPVAPPFAASAFTLSIVIPAQIAVSAAGPVLSEFYLPVSGSYTNDGQTETFSTAYADFGATNAGLPTFADNFALDIVGLLQPADSYVLSFQASEALFSPTIFTAGVPETITVGGLDITNANAAYGADPAFAGALDIVPQTVVPEPAGWAMILLGFGAAGAMTRHRRGRPRVDTEADVRRTKGEFRGLRSRLFAIRERRAIS